VLLLLASGALEGATVGLLVPLLAVVTGNMGGGDRFPLNGLLPANPVERVAVISAGILGLAVLKNVLGAWGNAAAGRLRANALVELRRQVLDRILRAAPATMERHTSGELTDMVVAEAYRVNRVLEATVVLIQRSTIAASYVVTMLVLSWRLTLTAIGVGAVVAFVSRGLGRRIVQHGRDVSKSSAELGRQVTEVVGGLRVIRTTSSEAWFEEQFDGHSQKHARADVGGGVALTLSQGITETLGILGALVLLGLANTVWRTNGALDAPRFLAFGFGLVRLLPALNVVYATRGMIAATIGSVERVLRWLDLPFYPTRAFGARQVPIIQQSIRFEDVGLTYPDGHVALRGFNLELRPGETLAVLGPSGSGKSSLANVLLRLREPTTGRVLFDGIDHWEFSASEFHRAVGFVDQDSFLFNVSIAENVRSGRAGVDLDAIWRALDVVRLRTFVEELPRGLDTVVAERGSSLSGGQRQRLAIARAIVVNPQILVLDEPTSALDPATEQEVVEAMHAASSGRTTLIITHRPSTTRYATRCLEMVDGKIATVAGAPQQFERAAI
jgi:ABC-type multidrug transport system fused ATPase/permease subunit